MARLSGPMDSNASVVTGAYLQDHPLVAYQSQGVLNTLDFQYSSLQADPLPVDTAALTTVSGSNSALITSITAALTVNGNSQGSAVTYNHINLSDGESYLVQVQAAQAGGYATGVYPDTLTITKFFSGGTQKVETYNDWLMQVNLSAPHTGRAGASAACSGS